MRSAKNDLQNTMQSQDTTPLLCSTSTSLLLFSSLVYSTSTLPLVYLYYLYYLHSTSSQVDTMISGLGSLRHMPTGHSDLWASENVTS